MRLNEIRPSGIASALNPKISVLAMSIDLNQTLL